MSFSVICDTVTYSSQEGTSSSVSAKYSMGSADWSYVATYGSALPGPSSSVAK